jgi:hypothetical protein
MIAPMRVVQSTRKTSVARRCLEKNFPILAWYSDISGSFFLDAG